MPCGGIYPIAEHFSRQYLLDNTTPNPNCITCHQRVDAGIDLFVEEFDAYLHRKCLGLFLCSPEGEVVIAHGHAIVVPEMTDDGAALATLGKAS